MPLCTFFLAMGRQRLSFPNHTYYNRKVSRVNIPSKNECINIGLLFSDVFAYRQANGLDVLAFCKKAGISPNMFYQIFDNANYNPRLNQLLAITTLIGENFSDYVTLSPGRKMLGWKTNCKELKDLPSFTCIKSYEDLFIRASTIYMFMLDNVFSNLIFKIEEDKSVSITLKIVDNLYISLNMRKISGSGSINSAIKLDNSNADADKSILSNKAYTKLNWRVVDSFIKICKREMIKYGKS